MYTHLMLLFKSGKRCTGCVCRNTHGLARRMCCPATEQAFSSHRRLLTSDSIADAPEQAKSAKAENDIQGQVLSSHDTTEL
jgi:hypothetical protein